MAELENKTILELYQIARENNLPGYYKLRKKELIFEITKLLTKSNELLEAKGILDIMPDGYGFLRPFGYVQSQDDIYVSPSQIRKFDLRIGDLIQGKVRSPREGERFYALLKVETVNGYPPIEAGKRIHFDTLTPIYPTERIRLSTTREELSTRIIDLVAPIGFGQRGMIVAPPKAGKTILLQKLAHGIVTNYPDVHLFILLIDERPEEVTDMQRNTKAEVIASTFDEPPENHVKISEMVLERAKRLVEHKQNVVILMDSLTRLARAYNVVVPPSGRTLSGGLDPISLNRPKRFFGAARNIEDGGSLTIIATALVETGSRMDDVIFEEFKGTGNMELQLDRKLSERRIFPAIDIKKSGTRKEELLFQPQELNLMWQLRNAWGDSTSTESMQDILATMKKTASNEDLLRIAPLILNENQSKNRPETSDGHPTESTDNSWQQARKMAYQDRSSHNSSSLRRRDSVPRTPRQP